MINVIVKMCYLDKGFLSIGTKIHSWIGRLATEVTQLRQDMQRLRDDISRYREDAARLGDELRTLRDTQNANNYNAPDTRRYDDANRGYASRGYYDPYERRY